MGNSQLRRLPLGILGISALFASSLGGGCAHHGAVAKAPLTPPMPPSATIAPSGGGRLFADPRGAVDAILAACLSGDETQVVAIFGEPARKLVSTGNAEKDRERCKRFVEASKQMTRVDPDAPGWVHIVVGQDDWKLPIPLVQTTGGWQFDCAAGAKEVAARRIGANELEAIRVLRAFVAAQREYKTTHGSYAQRFASTPGRQDGLSWASRRGRPSSPFSSEFGAAMQKTGWSGYRYKILTARRENVAGRPREVHGKRTEGFALLAWPTAYRTTGMTSFLVDDSGKILEKDLGESTPAIASGMTRYDPDSSWKPVSN